MKANECGTCSRSRLSRFKSYTILLYVLRVSAANSLVVGRSRQHKASQGSDNAGSIVFPSHVYSVESKTQMRILRQTKVNPGMIQLLI